MMMGRYDDGKARACGGGRRARRGEGKGEEGKGEKKERSAERRGLAGNIEPRGGACLE